MRVLPTPRPCVFLDRDGVITRPIGKEHGFINKPDELQLIDGVPEAIHLLNDAGIPVVVVTNQGGVARGYMTEDDLDAVHDRMVECLEDRRTPARVDRIHYCVEIDDVPDRKPRPGMLYKAAWELDIDLSCSFMVGDHWDDLLAAHAAGVDACLVMTGRGKKTWEEHGLTGTLVDFTANDLLHMVTSIILPRVRKLRSKA